jgi:DNA primase
MKYNPYQIERTLVKYKGQHVDMTERLTKLLESKPVYEPFSKHVLEHTREQFPGSPGEAYMHDRGFTDETLSHFSIGYSAKQNMVVVPMHDPDGMPIGLIGRTASKHEKEFKNSKNLPKSRTAWNYHRAKRLGDTIIICEASFDAMRIHQAGFPNVIALLGGSVTPWHLEQINKVFSKVIIMTDFDKPMKRANCRLCKNKRFAPGAVRCEGHRPGRELGRSIAKGLPNKKILWAAFDDTCVYPHGAKDASDMTDSEIYQCLSNAVSNFEYAQWNPEQEALAQGL